MRNIVAHVALQLYDSTEHLKLDLDTNEEKKKYKCFYVNFLKKKK